MVKRVEVVVFTTKFGVPVGRTPELRVEGEEPIALEQVSTITATVDPNAASLVTVTFIAATLRYEIDEGETR